MRYVALGPSATSRDFRFCAAVEGYPAKACKFGTDLLTCLDEPYATRLTYKQSNPDCIFQLSDATADRLFQTPSLGAACQKLRSSAAASTCRRNCHTTWARCWRPRHAPIAIRTLAALRWGSLDRVSSVRKGADAPSGDGPNLKRLLETIDSRTVARARVVGKDHPFKRVKDEAANHRFSE
jgi:hypothetical protein